VTMPSGAAGLDPTFADTGITNNISSLANNTQANVTANHQSGLQSNSLFTGLSSQFFDVILGGFQSLTNLVEMVVQSITGVAGGVLSDIAGFMSGLVGSVSSAISGLSSLANDLLHNVVSVVGAIPQALVTGLTGALSSAASTVSGVIDGIVNGFLGLFGSGFGVSDAQAAAASIAEQQAATAAGVALLQQQSSTAAQSGTSAFVDFSTMADATSLGAGFAQFYSGAGTNTWGIASGRVSVIAPSGITGGRVAHAVYAAADTLTDFQSVSAVFSSSQMVTAFGFGLSSFAYGFNYIDGRSDATGANCVRAIFGNGTLWFGAVISGVWTQWTTKAHAFKPGAIYSLECGTQGGIRQYKVLCNSVPVLVWTEVGTASSLGAGFRKSGLGAEWQLLPDGGGGLFYAGPASVAAFAVADSTLPSLIGSIGRAYRASTTSALSAAAVTAYPPIAGMFDTTDYASTDLSFVSSTGKWTVTKRGNYLISAQMRCQLTNQVGYPTVYVNSVPRVSGNTGANSSVNCIIALSPGDFVQLGYAAFVALDIVGDAAGANTWFQIARVTEDVVS
jgi:hypothetical protein